MPLLNSFQAPDCPHRAASGALCLEQLGMDLGVHTMSNEQRMVIRAFYEGYLQALNDAEDEINNDPFLTPCNRDVALESIDANRDEQLVFSRCAAFYTTAVQSLMEVR
jgi:hypothetical protein